MDDASKDNTNLHFRSKYADLASVRAAIRKPLSDNGIAYSQFVRFDHELGFVEVETILMHADSGEWISGALAIPVMKRDAHGIGSATTYGRRFGLMAAAGLAPDEDDDGNKASERPQSNSQRTTNYTPKPTPPPAAPIDEIPHMEPNPAQQAAAEAQTLANTARQTASATASVAKMAATAAMPKDDWKARERAKNPGNRRADPAVSETLLAAVLSDLADVSTKDELSDWVKRRQDDNTRSKLLTGHVDAMEQAFRRKQLLFVAPKPEATADVDPETGEVLEAR